MVVLYVESDLETFRKAISRSGTNVSVSITLQCSLQGENIFVEKSADGGDFFYDQIRPVIRDIFIIIFL
jgi:hypothetical protein